MTESKLYQKKLKPLLMKKGYFFQRFEQEHIPDLYLAKNGKVLWLELKVINHSKSKVLNPDWRPGQLAWIYKHEGKGGEIILLCLWYVNRIYFLPPKECYLVEEIEKIQKEI